MIKWGKPVLNLEYKTIKYISITTVCLNMFLVFDSITVFTAAVKTKRNVGDYINMVTENDGNVLPALLAIPGILSLPLNILSIYLLYKAFDYKRQPNINFAMFIFILISVGSLCIMFIICIMVLSHSYGSHEALHNGMSQAMRNYSTNSRIKSRIDLLQIQFQCCGSKHYNEWFNIEWYDINLVKNPNKQQTPFSCCSMRSVFPCIHHGIESTNLPYRYSHELNFSLSSNGCYEVIKAKKRSVGWSIIGQIFMLLNLQIAMTVCFRFIQTAHFQENQFSSEEKTYTSWLIGYYIKKPRKVAPPVPPIPNELKT